MTDTLLSDREHEAWQKTGEMTYDEAAEDMGITRSPLEGYLERAYSKRKKARETLNWMDAERDTSATCDDGGVAMPTTDPHAAVMFRGEDGEHEGTRFFCSDCEENIEVAERPHPDDPNPY